MSTQLSVSWEAEVEYLKIIYVCLWDVFALKFEYGWVQCLGTSGQNNETIL